MNESKISVRYAKALFQYALELKKLDSVKKDIELVYNTISSAKEFDIFMLSPITKMSEKKSFVDKVFKGHVSAETISFLNLMIKNKREAHIAGASRNFLQSYKKHLGIKSVEILSAQTFSSELKEKIVSIIEKEMKTKVEMNDAVDETLLGGFILRIDDQQYDASVSNKLKQVKKRLLETSLRN